MISLANTAALGRKKSLKNTAIIEGKISLGNDLFEAIRINYLPIAGVK